MKIKEILINTPKHNLKLDLFYGFTNSSKIKVKKDCFAGMCKSGCKNHNQKYSCPPSSPNFSSCIKDNQELLVVLLKIDLNQLPMYKEYHKLRVGNAVIKPRIEKLMRSLEENFGGKYLSTGACRLCKHCQKKLDKPCKHPDKMRFSLEAVGVDCRQLSQDLFNLPLLWYKNKKAPKYTLVICALPIKKPIQKELSINLTILK